MYDIEQSIVISFIAYMTEWLRPKVHVALQIQATASQKYKRRANTTGSSIHFSGRSCHSRRGQSQGSRFGFCEFLFLLRDQLLAIFSGRPFKLAFESFGFRAWLRANLRELT